MLSALKSRLARASTLGLLSCTSQQAPAPQSWETGALPVVSSSLRLDLESGCRMRTLRWAPEEEAPRARVILVHGFMRRPERLAGWAQQLARWGYEVYAPELCHARMRDADHLQNGRDLVLLSQSLGGKPVIYAGHSAGGLAALIAGAEDPDALGVLALDPVDWRGEGLARARTLSRPLRGLLADPHPCNAEGNAEALFTAGSETMGWRLPGADHCEFESPTDLLCRRFCAQESPPDSDEVLQGLLLELYPLLLESLLEDRAPLGLEDWIEQGMLQPIAADPKN